MPSIDLTQYKTKKKPASSRSQQKEPTGGLFALLNREITFGSKEYPDKKKEYLYMELSSLLRAGVNLKSSFELVAADQHKPADKAMFNQVQNAVVNGAPFSEALQQTGKFSRYEVFSLQIGEETGKLNEVLTDLASYYQNKIKQRRKIVSALTYPCIVMLTSFGAVFFMLKFVVPMFGDVFTRFGGELPWITAKIIRLSKAFENGFWYLLLSIVTLGVFIFYSRDKEWFRKSSSTFVLKIPVIGPLVQKIYLARFANVMRLLINAKLPLLRAIALIRQMIAYYPVETALAAIEQDIMKGSSLHESLKQFSVFPSKMVQLVKVGEETNQLDHFFARIAEQYVDEVEFKTAAISSMMEPLIIIFLGLIVGVILVAMYLPLFQMSNTFQ